MNAPDRTPEVRRSLTYGDASRIIGFVLLLLIGWFLVRSLQSTLLLFAVVFLVAMVLNPIIIWLETHRIPRVAGVVLLLVGLLILAVLVTIAAGPPLVSELHDFGGRAPAVWHDVHARIDSSVESYPTLKALVPSMDEITAKVAAQAGDIANFLIKSTAGVIGGVFGLIFALMLLIFVLANPRPLVSGYLALMPNRYRDSAGRALTRFMQQVVAWARGVLINGAISGIITGALLWLIGVQPALVFGLLTFLGQLAPPLGPMIVALPVLLVALSMGATKFWLTLAAILFVQQGVTTVVVPYVFGRAMRLHPVVIIFFTLAAASLLGLVGAILAIPIAALVQIVIDEFYLRPRHLDYGEIDRDAAGLLTGKSNRAVPEI